MRRSVIAHRSDTFHPYIGFTSNSTEYCVHTSYTFRPAKKKFDKLIEQYKLVKVEDE